MSYDEFCIAAFGKDSEDMGEKRRSGRNRYGGLDESPLSESETEDRMQYWYSKMCNSITTDEKEIYRNLYEAYKKFYEMKFGKK